MMYEEIFERLEGMTVVEVAEAKGGGLAILLENQCLADDGSVIRDPEVGPAILVAGGENATMCEQDGDWEALWNKARV